MSREVRRVPVGFDWPLSKVWAGFVQPDWLDEQRCPFCENGYSAEAERLFKRWYGYVPFDPAEEGSAPFPADHPRIRAFAVHNVELGTGFYGKGEEAVQRESRRLAGLWNSAWSHHLAQDAVDALVNAGRMTDLTHQWEHGSGWKPIDPPVHLTPEIVNSWSIGFGFGHDSLNAGIVIEARCAREGLPLTCSSCGGHASLERFVGQRAAAEAWQPLDPPTGEAWQLWETVTEGSPISPAFETSEELARHIAEPGLTVADALVWITQSGWAPSGIFTSSGAASNVRAGVQIMKLEASA